ncbi:MAG: PilZ domain-containing protein [Lentisphaerae bacterium]|nr:PilZ domain-containing protein [Lentisphaerota bacterium]
MDPRDRRREPRIPVKDRISVTLVSAPGIPHIEQHVMHCTMHDVSMDGLNFQTYTHMPVGTTVDVIVKTEDTGTEIRRRGEVVWERSSQEDIVLSQRIGVRLLRAAGQLEDAWRRLLDTKMALQPA